MKENYLFIYIFFFKKILKYMLKILEWKKQKIKH